MHHLAVDVTQEVSRDGGSGLVEFLEELNLRSERSLSFSQLWDWWAIGKDLPQPALHPAYVRISTTDCPRTSEVSALLPGTAAANGRQGGLGDGVYSGTGWVLG